MKPDLPAPGTLQTLLTWATRSDCPVYSFSVSFIGCTEQYHICLCGLSEADLDPASVVLTRMFSVPDSRSVVLHSSPAKAAHCYFPFCS